MPQTAFTDLFLRKVKPPEKGRVEYYDGRIPGFGLRVNATGAKTFFLVGRHGRAFRRVTLGRYPTVSLEKARRKANDALRALEDGVDPNAEKRAERMERSDSFASVVRDFVEKHCKRNNRASTAAENERLLRSVFVPRWKNIAVPELTKRDVLNVIDDIMDAGTPSAARHAFAVIRKFFNWCLERGIIEHSPCATLKMPGKHKSRDRVLNDDELTSVVSAAKQIGWPYGPIVLLLVFTAQRRNEVVGMLWEEIDRKARTWTMSGDRTKNHKAHTVPLTDAALAVLDSISRVAGCAYVFPARGYTDRPYSGHSKGKRELDAVCGIKGWTLHDLRRTAATGMAKAGVAPHVVEKVLNHVSGTFGGVAGVYNRFQYLDEMRAALTSWEERLSASNK